MKTKLYPRLFAFLVAGFFLLAVMPVSHHSSVAWAGTKIERGSGGEVDGDPEEYNDSISGPLRTTSHHAETTRVPNDDRQTFFVKLLRIYAQLVAILTSGRWIL